MADQSPYRGPLALVLLAALAVPGCLRGAEPLIPQPVRQTAASLGEQALADDAAWDFLRSLVVEVGPRFAGSEADRRAVDWAVARLTRLGLANVRTEAVTVPRWERGEGSGRITAPFPQPVVLTALGGSVATPPGGVEAEVLRVGSLAELTALAGGAAAGKIVFIDERMERAKTGAGYGPVVVNRRDGAVEAARRGAVAVLIRSVGTSEDRVAHTGSLRYQEGVAEIPAAALAHADADVLAAQVASGRKVTFHLRLDTRRLGETESANVIAEVVGRERPEEIVLLGAHLDSWDLGFGAVDDGAGCAIVSAAAALIAKLPEPPRRTVRVVLYANEEFGLSGARAYAEAHAAELPRHVAAAESDFGSGRVWALGSGVEPAALPLVAEIVEVLAPLGIGAGGNGGRGGADLIPLRPHRVPIFGLFQDGSLYFDVHHTINDTLDEVDPEDLRQNVAAWAAFAYLAAEVEADFGRAPAPENGE